MNYSELTACAEEPKKDVSIKDALQEANKILNEVDAMLNDIEVNVVGKRGAGDQATVAECLHDEAKQITGMAYECLCKVKRIKDVLI